jgi:hypothetical protein
MWPKGNYGAAMGNVDPSRYLPTLFSICRDGRCTSGWSLATNPYNQSCADGLVAGSAVVQSERGFQFRHPRYMVFAARLTVLDFENCLYAI